MTWLIRLYPPAWRRRYGRELAELLAAQPASFRTAVDLVAGAVDAWLNPQSSTAVATTDAKGTGAMLPKMLQLKSGGYGPDVTAADSLKAAAVTIGGTLALVGVLMGATKLYGKNAYFEALLAMGWLVPFLFSQHYTYLKGRPARVQAVLIGGPAVIVIAIALGNAWLNIANLFDDRLDRLPVPPLSCGVNQSSLIERLANHSASTANGGLLRARPIFRSETSEILTKYEAIASDAELFLPASTSKREACSVAANHAGLV